LICWTISVGCGLWVFAHRTFVFLFCFFSVFAQASSPMYRRPRYKAYLGTVPHLGVVVFIVLVVFGVIRFIHGRNEMDSTQKANRDFCTFAPTLCHRLCLSSISSAECPTLCPPLPSTNSTVRLCPLFLSNSTYCVLLNGCASCYIHLDLYFDFACAQLDTYEEGRNKQIDGLWKITFFSFTALLCICAVLYQKRNNDDDDDEWNNVN
jgi:hypothetical protein